MKFDYLSFGIGAGVGAIVGAIGASYKAKKVIKQHSEKIAELEEENLYYSEQIDKLDSQVADLVKRVKDIIGGNKEANEDKEVTSEDCLDEKDWEESEEDDSVDNYKESVEQVKKVVKTAAKKASEGSSTAKKSSKKVVTRQPESEVIDDGVAEDLLDSGKYVVEECTLFDCGTLTDESMEIPDKDALKYIGYTLINDIIKMSSYPTPIYILSKQNSVIYRITRVEQTYKEYMSTIQ